MNLADLPGVDALPVLLALHINRLCDRHEAAWRAGARPRIEDVLTLEDEPGRTVLLREMLAAELAARRHRCEAPDFREYGDRFPDDAALVAAIFAEARLADDEPATPDRAQSVAAATSPRDGADGDTPADRERSPHSAGGLDLPLERHRGMETHHEPACDRSGRMATLGTRREITAGGESERLPEIPGYEVAELLGRGGMGVVYWAWQKGLNRPVALKLVHAGAQASPATLARFRIEAEAVARLQHSNIVQIYDVGQHAGAPYLVLELVEGGNLAQRVAGTPQPVRWAAGLVEAVARGTQAAHHQGVVHRDLTPTNILLTADGTPKITDFGLAKLIIGGGDLRTQTGELLGTPSYMAPEQAAGRQQAIGAATDLYALGAILYELLSGRPPFKAESPLETLRQVVSDEPVPPSRLRPHLPRDLETICLKCLSKEPARRYADALALAEDLRLFLEGRAILARRSGGFERAWRWCRRNPGLAAMNLTTAALVVLLTVGSTLAAWNYRNQVKKVEVSEARARAEYEEGQKQLFQALYDRARAQRFSRQVGQRFQSLAAIEAAVRIGRKLNLPPEKFELLRDEAIACMALPDLEPTGRVIPRPPGVLVVVFDLAMTRYALYFRNGTVKVCRVVDDAEVDRFEVQTPRGYDVFRFSPDGRYLALVRGAGRALTVRDVDCRTFALHDPGPVGGTAGRFSPDSLRLALCRADGTTLIYDLATGRQGGLWGGPASARDLAFSADGAQIAVVHGEPGKSCCRILDSRTGRLVRSITLPAPGVGVAWSPDGRTLATTCQDNKLYLWDTATATSKGSLEGTASGGLVAAFHPTGALLLTYSWESQLRLWEPVLARPVVSLTSSRQRPEFSADGRTVVSREDRLILYQADPALEYRTLAHAFGERVHYERASIRRDGRVLAVGTDRGVALWDLARGTELPFLAIGLSRHVLFEALGDLITSGSSGVQRWPIRLDAGHGEFRIGPPRRLPLPASDCGIDEDRPGRIVALANYHTGHVAIDGRTVPVGTLDDCRYVAVSPDGEWLATGNHEGIGFQVWHVPDGRLVADPTPRIDGPVRVTFSPDGKWLMTSPSPCRLWAVGTWLEVRQFSGEGRCFSPDGRLIVVSEVDQALRLVETDTGRAVARLESPDLCRTTWATFSPDGSRLVVVTNDGPAVHVWDLRRIRRRLAGMGLDWDAPPYTDTDPLAVGASGPPLSVVAPGRFKAEPLLKRAAQLASSVDIGASLLHID
jgi:eukaryotic-like serine/threonine-protein kinase